MYPLSRVPTTGVFVRFVAVDNTNLAVVRTSEVRITSVYFNGGSTEAGECRRSRNRMNYFRIMVAGILDSLFVMMVVFFTKSESTVDR